MLGGPHVECFPEPCLAGVPSVHLTASLQSQRQLAPNSSYPRVYPHTKKHDSPWKRFSSFAQHSLRATDYHEWKTMSPLHDSAQFRLGVIYSSISATVACPAVCQGCYQVVSCLSGMYWIVSGFLLLLSALLRGVQ